MKIIPYSHQSIDKKDIEAVVKVLKSDFITQGPRIAEFEAALCRYTGAKHAVAVSSGTSALHLACLAAGVKRGDSVITSPITFVASANCALYLGATPLFIDVQGNTGSIDAGHLERFIKGLSAIQRKRLKAVIPVHYAGHPCDMEKMGLVARRYRLTLIEDASHALGAEYHSDQKGAKTFKVGSCSHSDMAVLSFHPVKTITTGEGGAVLTNRRDLYDRLILYRNHGITKERGKLLSKTMRSAGWYHEMQGLGFNYRMSDIQAALGISQLKKIGVFISKRRKMAARYLKELNNSRYFDMPQEKGFAVSSYHLFPLRLKRKFADKKARVFNYLRKKGIGVQVHYIPVYLQPYYRRLGYKKGLCREAEDFYNREISIPIYPDLTGKQQGYVIRTLKGLHL